MSGAGRKYYGKGKGKGKKSDDSGVPTCSKCGNTTNLADKVSSSQKNPGKHYWKCMAKDDEGTWCNGFAGWVIGAVVAEAGDQSEESTTTNKRKGSPLVVPGPTLEAFEELEEQVKETRVKLARVTKRVDGLELLRSAAEAPAPPPPTQLDHEEEIEDDQ
jgi:hypothetical protein